VATGTGCSNNGQCSSGTCYKVTGEVDFSNSQPNQAHRNNYIEIYGVFSPAQGSVTLGGWQCAVSYWSTNQVNCVVNANTPTGFQTVTVSTAGVNVSLGGINVACTASCGGKACGQSDGCGGTCCQGSGCTTPSCPVCQQPDSGCGSMCVASPFGTGCSAPGGIPGSCNGAGSCTGSPPHISGAGASGCGAAWITGSNFPTAPYIAIDIRDINWNIVGNAAYIINGGSTSLTVGIPSNLQSLFNTQGLRFTVVNTNINQWDTSAFFTCP
jgi:hypothetical protein